MRWIVASVWVLAGFVIPLVVVDLILVWTAPEPQGSDMALGLYAFFLGVVAGLLGMVLTAVVSVRWLRGSLRHLGVWMSFAGLIGPVIFGVALSLAR